MSLTMCHNSLLDLQHEYHIILTSPIGEALGNLKHSQIYNCNQTTKIVTSTIDNYHIV
jgi:hypothetical protein